MYPPLADSIGRYVAVATGRAYLVHVFSFGMNGPISVHDQTYKGVMQPWPQFTDEDVAAVLNYVLTTFNVKLLPGKFKPLTADEVKKYRAGNLSMGDVYNQRAALLKSLRRIKAELSSRLLLFSQRYDSRRTWSRARRAPW